MRGLNRAKTGNLVKGQKFCWGSITASPIPLRVLEKTAGYSSWDTEGIQCTSVLAQHEYLKKLGLGVHTELKGSATGGDISRHAIHCNVRMLKVLHLALGQKDLIDALSSL